MPIIKSAIKRMHQAAKRRTRNIATKRDLKVAMKAFVANMTAENLSKAQAQLDIAVKKNILEKNTASRRKASLAASAKAAGVKLAGTAKKAETSAKPAAAKKASAAKKPATKKATPKKTV